MLGAWVVIGTVHLKSVDVGREADCASLLLNYRFAGLVVKASASRAEDPACTKIFPGLSHTSDLKFGTPVATLPGAWRYRVSAWTGRSDVSIL